MPFNGLQPFLHMHTRLEFMKKMCVNALQRASAISTNIELRGQDLKKEMC